MHTRQTFLIVSVSLLIMSFSISCTAPQATATIPPVDMTTPSPAPSATMTPTQTQPLTPIPPEHRIGVRVVDGVGEFYDRLSGEKFTPRGSNYIRLGTQQGVNGGAFYIYHSTFNVNSYHPSQAEENLALMSDLGYNVVRVFLNGGCKSDCIGDAAGGISKAYVANLVDFLNKAKAHGIYLLLTTDGEPGTKYYIDLLDTTWSVDFEGNNKSFLTGGGVLVARRFWQDLIKALQDQFAPMDAIFAYELRNELFFEANLAPLNRTSGTIATANGKSYDMSSVPDNLRMIEENLVNWIDTVRAAILQRDPTALVTVGFFIPQAPNSARPGDPRLIVTEPSIWESQADFIDLHLYPGFGLNMQQHAENFGINGMQEKPILMGEFGANKDIYRSAAAAAGALANWQADSCTFGFDGWLTWTWDMVGDVYFYNALEDGGKISQALAPSNMPDPCLVP